MLCDVNTDGIRCLQLIDVTIMLFHVYQSTHHHHHHDKKNTTIFDKYVQVPAQLLECAMHQNNKDIAISTHNPDTRIQILCKMMDVKCGKNIL